jgi:hypothetical protein
MENNIVFKNTTRISKFIKSGKNCCSKNCIRNFYELQEDELFRFEEDLAQCSQDAKEAALLMNLREHLYNPQFVCRGNKRKRQRIAYSVAPFGSMCRTAYLLLWDIGVSTLKNYLTYMANQAYTFRPRIHGRSGSVSPTALNSDLREQVVRFILELAANLGEASEGRQVRRNLHTVKDKVVYFLPAPYSISNLYRQFLKKYRHDYPQLGNTTPLSLSSFRSIFYSDPCKHIRIRSPRSDVCDECTLYRAFYKQQPECSSSQTSKIDEEKIKRWQQHLELAKEARLVYNNDIKQAQETLQKLKNKSLELNDYVAHYTFDFMQNLTLPNFADMTKDMYFLSLRNIHVFSIRDDGEKKQFNYLYDEGDGGKGANYVISMLFYFLRQRPQQFATLTIHLHADNCCGQNKNNLVMQFFLFMVHLGFLKHVELKFMIRGHTHCSIDGGHGIIKKNWRKHDVCSIEQAAQVIVDSSPVAGINHAVILRTEIFFNWEQLLGKYFNKLPNLMSFQEFEMDSARKGIIRYRERSKNLWQKTQLVKKEIPEFSSMQHVKNILKQLTPPGISERKQKHLYEKVRKYVPEELKDIICPEPINY